MFQCLSDGFQVIPLEFIGPPKISKYPFQTNNLTRLQDTRFFWRLTMGSFAFNPPNFNFSRIPIFWRHVDFIIFQCPHSSSYQHQQKGQETMRKPSKIQLPTNFLAISWIVPGSWIQMDPVQSDLPKFSILQSSLNPWTDMMATWFLTIFVETTWCKITKMQRRVIVFGYASMPTPKFSPGLGFVILFRFSKPHFPVSHLYQTLSNAIFYWGTHGLPMPKARIHRFIMWEANTRASKNETHYILITSWCHC